MGSIRIFKSLLSMPMFSRQCDEEGIKQNALVPTYHCMHTPGGPLKYSLGNKQFINDIIP